MVEPLISPGVAGGALIGYTLGTIDPLCPQALEAATTRFPETNPGSNASLTLVVPWPLITVEPLGANHT